MPTVAVVYPQETILSLPSKILYLSYLYFRFSIFVIVVLLNKKIAGTNAKALPGLSNLGTNLHRSSDLKISKPEYTHTTRR
jgi:hypothetical protein